MSVMKILCITVKNFEKRYFPNKHTLEACNRAKISCPVTLLCKFTQLCCSIFVPVYIVSVRQNKKYQLYS